MSNVIQIESLRLKFQQKNSAERSASCKHMNLTFDSEGHVVTCDDCSRQISAFWVVEMMSEQYEKAFARLRRREQAVEQAEQNTLISRAAKRVDEVWRGRTMAPICPHCSEAILPEDGMGSSRVSREAELARRRARAIKGPVDTGV
jgi:hypothetical protein